MTLTILADDLTGACDTGCLFARMAPVPVMVWPASVAEADVRVVDTETRGATPASARGVVHDTATAAPADRYFKKIDSTLRGNVGSEVDALVTVTTSRRALVCPAFPAQGRVVRDRVLLVHGDPVGTTPIALDPAFPRGTTSSVVELLRPHLTTAVAWIPLADVRAGRDALSAHVERLAGTVAVVDAETDEDLDALVEAALTCAPAPLLVGSAGLARALAARLGLLADVVAIPPARRWLVVIGSRHPVSRLQAACARRAQLPVLATSDEDAPDRAAVAAQLARDAVGIIERDAVDLLAVSGGDTALALYRALGADRIELIGAPSPGLALGRLAMPDREPLWILTKAGAFGEADLFGTLARRAAA